MKSSPSLMMKKRFSVTCSGREMTVNAAPFAIPIYEKAGFNVNDVEQIVNGIRFTPMTIQI